jgi:hypothetical protein
MDQHQHQHQHQHQLHCIALHCFALHCIALPLISQTLTQSYAKLPRVNSFVMIVVPAELPNNHFNLACDLICLGFLEWSESLIWRSRKSRVKMNG